MHTYIHTQTDTHTHIDRQTQTESYTHIQTHIDTHRDRHRDTDIHTHSHRQIHTTLNVKQMQFENNINKKKSIRTFREGGGILHFCDHPNYLFSANEKAGILSTCVSQPCGDDSMFTISPVWTPPTFSPGHGVTGEGHRVTGMFAGGTTPLVY